MSGGSRNPAPATNRDPGEVSANAGKKRERDCGLGHSIETDPAHSWDLSADAEGTLSALLSVGMRKWEALGQMVSAFEPESPPTSWAKWAAGHCEGFDDVRYVADGLAVSAPHLGDALLQEWLRGRRAAFPVGLSDRGWITALPEGLRVEEDLYLVGCHGLQELPEGLRVGGDLYLLDCVALRAFPKGLEVGKNIFCNGCVAWDEVVPRDAQIGGDVFIETRPIFYAKPGDKFCIMRC